MHTRRPLGVTLLAAAVFLLAVWNAWQAYTAGQQLSLMRDLGLDTVARLRFVSGLTWAAGFALAALGLWRLRRWGRVWTLIAVPLFWLTVWIDRLALQRAAYVSLTQPAAIVVTLGVIAAVWGMLFLPRIRRAFQTA